MMGSLVVCEVGADYVSTVSFMSYKYGTTVTCFVASEIGIFDVTR
jgi:hypothetical protein